MANGEVYSLSDIDPSTATDLKIIECLRARVQHRQESSCWWNPDAHPDPGIIPNIHMLHPSGLPSWSFVQVNELPCLPKSFKYRWCSAFGSWEEVSATAIRLADAGTEGLPPNYTGVKRTMEFHDLHGAKTDWVMIQYSLLSNSMGFCSFKEEILLCKVFHPEGKGPSPSGPSDAKGQLHNPSSLNPMTSTSCGPVEDSSVTSTQLGDAQDSRMAPTQSGPVEDSSLTPATLQDSFFEGIIVPFGAQDHHTDLPTIDDFPNGGISFLGHNFCCDDNRSLRSVQDIIPDAVQQLTRKRSRSKADGKSEVWKHFTKIYTDDPDVVYAACHCCDTMLKAHSKKAGTSHLWRHHRSCSSNKRPDCYPRTPMKSSSAAAQEQSFSWDGFDFQIDFGCC